MKQSNGFFHSSLVRRHPTVIHLENYQRIYCREIINRHLKQRPFFFNMPEIMNSPKHCYTLKYKNIILGINCQRTSTGEIRKSISRLYASIYEFNARQNNQIKYEHMGRVLR